MTATTPDHRTVFAAVELANHAPSTHHAQPWRWLVGNHSVHLMASGASRDVLLDCGAALHHLQVAFAALGWGTVVHRIPNEHDLDHLAAVSSRPRPPTPEDLALADAITRRRTDRRRFTSWAVPESHLDRMAGAAARAGALLAPVRLRTRRLELAAPGGGARWHDPDPVEEGNGGELLVVATPDDDPVSVLRAGEAASAALLVATDLGLATCQLPLETVPDGATHPHLVLRVGWASTATPPPSNSLLRRTEDTIDYLPGTHLRSSSFTPTGHGAIASAGIRLADAHD